MFSICLRAALELECVSSATLVVGSCGSLLHIISHAVSLYQCVHALGMHATSQLYISTACVCYYAVCLRVCQILLNAIRFDAPTVMSSSCIA